MPGLTVATAETNFAQGNGSQKASAPPSPPITDMPSTGVRLIR
ncbi:hypothetical protein [Jannaschia sp. R86511]